MKKPYDYFILIWTNINNKLALAKWIEEWIWTNEMVKLAKDDYESDIIEWPLRHKWFEIKFLWSDKYLQAPIEWYSHLKLNN